MWRARKCPRSDNPSPISPATTRSTGTFIDSPPYCSNTSLDEVSQRVAPKCSMIIRDTSMLQCLYCVTFQIADLGLGEPGPTKRGGFVGAQRNPACLWSVRTQAGVWEANNRASAGSADLINHRVMRVGPGAGTRVSADTVMWTFLFDSYRKDNFGGDRGCVFFLP